MLAVQNGKKTSMGILIEVFFWNDLLRGLSGQPDDLNGLRAFGRVFDRKLNPLSLIQVTVSLADDGRKMDEYVLFLVVWLDETVAFDAAEPTHGALKPLLFCHKFEFLLIP